MEIRRVHVGVESTTDEAGRVTPTAILWRDGRSWPVRVVGRVPQNVDPSDRWRSVRYTVEVGRGKARRTLWFDPPACWYVLSGCEEAAGTHPLC